MDSVVPEIIGSRIGAETIPAVQELVGGAQAHFRKLVTGYADTIEVDMEESRRKAWKAPAARIAAIPAEAEQPELDDQEHGDTACDTS